MSWYKIAWAFLKSPADQREEELGRIGDEHESLGGYDDRSVQGGRGRDGGEEDNEGSDVGSRGGRRGGDGGSVRCGEGGSVEGGEGGGQLGERSEGGRGSCGESVGEVGSVHKRKAVRRRHVGKRCRLQLYQYPQSHLYRTGTVEVSQPQLQ